MPKTKRYFFLLAIILVTNLSFHKDLNEYGKWLAFYGLKDEDFKQIGTDKQEKLEWKPYSLTGQSKKLYEPLYFYSGDSVYFLDLDSYSVSLEKDSLENLTWTAGNPESKVQIVKSNGLSSSTLLFFGTNGFAEAAIWRNKFLFEVFGFRKEENKYIPTIWKYDLEQMTCKEFQSKKTFTKLTKNYSAEVRFKGMKER